MIVKWIEKETQIYLVLAKYRYLIHYIEFTNTSAPKESSLRQAYFKW